VIVMPAYNAAQTLEETYRGIAPGVADEILLVDDASRDETVEVAKKLNLKVFPLPHNVGYGGNQKTCYLEALRYGADIVVMLHPDGQYDPTLLPELIRPIQAGRADLVLGSRMLVPGSARRGGMPLYKRVANRTLSTLENFILRRKLSEYHTGYRAYSRQFLERIPFLRNANDFVFDSQILAQAVAFNMRIVEIPVATRYFKEASSTNFRQSVVYGLKTVWTMLRYALDRVHLWPCRLFQP
jgi:glycosyltransferase involved in cell wall biosynthesis